MNGPYNILNAYAMQNKVLYTLSQPQPPMDDFKRKIISVKTISLLKTTECY